MADKKPRLPASPRPEVLAFQEAIRDNPEDDTPRLVLADWLEEHGDPDDQSRARYIRLQCEVARMPAGAEQDRRAGEAWEMYEGHHRGWLKRYFAMRKKVRGTFRFERGSRGLLRLIADARTLGSSACLALAATEDFAWADSLRVESGSAVTLAALVDSPVFDRVTTLDLSDVPVRADGMKELARSAGLRRLHHLNLRGSHIEHEGVKALARAPLATSLRSLNLYRNMIWPDSLRDLARSGGLRHLRQLTLGFHKLEDGVRHLAHAPWLGSLEHLDLSESWTTDDGLIPLVESPGVGNLRRLELRDNGVTAAGVRALARSPHLGRLRELDLSFNPVSADGLLSLAGSELLGRLEKLHLVRVGMGPASVRALVESPFWGSLRHLTLISNPVGTAGAVLLAEAVSARRLDVLELAHCGVDDAAMGPLRAALESNRVGVVSLSPDTLSAGARQQLQEQFPGRVQLF